MATSQIEVKGLREIAIAARKLTDELQKKIGGIAVLGGARIIRNAARGLAPVLKSKYSKDDRRTPGLLRAKLVAVKVRKGDFPEEIVAIVGIRLPSKASIKKYKQTSGRAGSQNPQDPFYWWFVEAGTRGHRRRQVSIPGTRFLKRGFEANAERAAHEIRDSAGRAIVKYGNTLAK